MTLEPLVLLVEDDRDTRQSVRQVLEEEGYVVEEASDGQAALQRLGRDPRPALVLLDLMMPVMSGQTLLLELETHPELASLPIVVMTASGIDEATSSLKVPILRKPVTIDALLRIAEQYSPRFWDDEETTTDKSALLSEPPRSTAKQTCALCGGKAATRCSGCGEPYCPRCFEAGSAGVCARCAAHPERD
jgi:CheY-like chemotaxis protein